MYRQHILVILFIVVMYNEIQLHVKVVKLLNINVYYCIFKLSKPIIYVFNITHAKVA